jgi:hypothetical protein
LAGLLGGAGATFNAQALGETGRFPNEENPLAPVELEYEAGLCLKGRESSESLPGWLIPGRAVTGEAVNRYALNERNMPTGPDGDSPAEEDRLVGNISGGPAAVEIVFIPRSPDLPDERPDDAFGWMTVFALGLALLLEPFSDPIPDEALFPLQRLWIHLSQTYRRWRRWSAIPGRPGLSLTLFWWVEAKEKTSGHETGGCL